MPPKLGSVDDALRPLMELAELAAPEDGEALKFSMDLRVRSPKNHGFY